jgi:hypothetical protein
VSKKNRQRRVVKAQGTAGKPASPELEAAVTEIFSSLHDAIAAGDLLQAEIATARYVTLPVRIGLEEAQADKFVTTSLVDGAETPDSAARLRLLMLLGSPGVKRAASQALARLTARGVYPPEWVSEAGKAGPAGAWRRYDAFGDGESIIVTYRYGEREHAVVWQITLMSVPVVVAIGVATDAAGLLEEVERGDDEFDRHERISLAEARQHVEPALARADFTPGREPDTAALICLPIARTRLRRLPAAGPAPVTREYTEADRAAAVEDFMKSPEAADVVAADAETARFWARVLTGYSSRTPGTPPAQAGPSSIALALVQYAARTFALTEAQRRDMEPVVSAWARWSAAYRGLGEAAADRITVEIPKALAMFDDLYARPGAVTRRAYLAGLPGLATGETDASTLADAASRRWFAMPPPGARRGEQADGLDAADPGHRREYLTAEFASCTPPDGMSQEQWISAVSRVIEELWAGHPAGTWQRAQDLTARGADRHDVIHALVS